MANFVAAPKPIEGSQFGVERSLELWIRKEEGRQRETATLDSRDEPDRQWQEPRGVANGTDADDVVTLGIQSRAKVRHYAFVVGTRTDPACGETHPGGVHNNLLQAPAHVDDGHAIVVTRSDRDEELVSAHDRPDRQGSGNVLEPYWVVAKQTPILTVDSDALHELGAIGLGQVSVLERAARAPCSHEIECPQFVHATWKPLGGPEAQLQRAHIEDENDEQDGAGDERRPEEDELQMTNRQSGRRHKEASYGRRRGWDVLEPAGELKTSLGPP